ncbi:uncharacterized protein LOC135951735 [Calliphora vicina]|uniref:uncharacterized protein LOC135951735 n=1 Tax=Calliphora vicina TaxID=7373 RepID=UPI00325B501E
MKLLYSVIILGLIQMVFVKPFEASPNSNATLLKQNLTKLLDNELESMDKDFSEKSKVLSEKLLQDKLVKQASTAILKQFKQNISDFLHVYPSYQRYHLTNQLVLLFEEKIPDPSSNKDIEYIWKLLEKHGYYEMDKDYESKYMKFVKHKFLPKFEEFKKQLNQQELKQHQDLINSYNELKRCQNYKCQSKYLYKIIGDFTPKDNLFEYIVEMVDNIHIDYGNAALEMAKAVLKDKRLSQLPHNLRINLTNNIKQFIKIYKKHEDINDLYNIINALDINILAKYYHNISLPLKQQQLIVQIFDDHGCAKFVSEYDRKLKDFVQQGLVVRFKQFKAALTRKELAKEKPLLQWYDHVKDLQNPEDILEALNKLEEIYENKM